MIITSHIRITLPREMSRYLLTIAAMMSVPPVEPFEARPSPTPEPQNTAPMMEAMKGLVVQQMTMIVGIGISSGQRQHQYRIDGLHTEFPAEYPQGYQKQYGIDAEIRPLHRDSDATKTTDDTPGTPPVVILLGSRKTFHPIQ